MKKLWVVLLSLGLIMAIAMPAAAVDVKFNGVWYMAGWYADNPMGLDKDFAYGNTTGPNANRGAAALYTHKLRLNTTFQIAEGLALKTQVDALENVMGDATWAGGSLGRQSQPTSSRSSLGANGASEQENFEFEAAWVDFKVPIGRFQAGFVPNGIGFGTVFLMDPYTWPTIRFDTQAGPVNIFASIFKIREWRSNDSFGRGGNSAVFGTGNAQRNDSDSDAYRLGAVMKFKPGEAGIMYEFWRDARAKQNAATAAASDGTGIIPADSRGWVGQLSTINPYAKLTFGPVYVEAEAYYRFGSLRKYEAFAVAGANPQQPDVTLNAYGAYLKGQFNFKPFFAGLQFIYMSGDDLQNLDKVTGSVAQWYGDNYVSPNGNLILWNFDYNDAMGWLYGNIPATGVNPRTNSTYANTRYMDNVWFYQVYFGVNPTAKLNITAKLAYATADKKPKMGVGDVGTVLTANTTSAAYVGAVNREFVSDKYGTEIDLIATYKIYDNLSYTIGAGYLFIGDYFKGYDDTAKLKDNYILTHKLTLAF